jgi:hypothetical protein
MKREAAKLRRDMRRYQVLLVANIDARTDKVLRELIEQTKARLREIATKPILSSVPLLNIRGSSRR